MQELRPRDRADLFSGTMGYAQGSDPSLKMPLLQKKNLVQKALFLLILTVCLAQNINVLLTTWLYFLYMRCKISLFLEK